MNRIALGILAAVSAFAFSGQAEAQTASGTVNVTGTVGARCSAVTPISGSIALGELAKSDGTVDGAFSGATSGLSRSFTILCNGINPTLSVNAKALVNSAVGTSPTGYTNTVNYTASVAAALAKGGSTTVADPSAVAGATVGALGDRLAVSTNNVTLTIGSGVTTDTKAVLEAGSYSGSVDIVITPAA